MYNVDLANDDCIFDSASDFENLAEVKEWVEKHQSRHLRERIRLQKSFRRYD